MSDNKESTRRAQRETLNGATRNGETWTDAEMSFVIANTDRMTDAQIAHALGRTLYGVIAIQTAMRNGRRTREIRGNANATRRARAESYVGWMEGDGDE